MANYKLKIRRSAEKELLILPGKDAARVVGKIQKLAQNPIPADSVKLAGYQDRFRLRQGDYRIIYSVDEVELSVMIVKIGHRREVYR